MRNAYSLQIFIKLFEKAHCDGTRKETTYQTVNNMNRKFRHSFLPVLATLNIIDAIASYVLFELYGKEIERNPIIGGLLTQFNGAENVFLFSKLILSGLILAYWHNAEKVPQTVIVLTMLGAALYSGMLLHGAYTFLII